ncbi:hypothetical protein PSENEW3n2_00000825 [Picochlorum sp. SENEW3]|nr:hypothetical protein PSENEW3n2_00000825 [Picochlorum sp. SENEW3]WPT15747.1 hypothetical protein PSENEW3_00000825 [Picochlorum sp. SENEW3]
MGKKYPRNFSCVRRILAIMQCNAILLLALIGVVQAARQITFPPPVQPIVPSPPPPPPASPGVAPVTFPSPGFVFSMIVKNTNQASWTVAQEAKFCDDLVSVNAPANTKESCEAKFAQSWNGTDALINGFFFYEWLSTPSVTQIQLASALRDQAVETLRQNASSILGQNFPGSYANCACDGPTAVVTASATSDFSYSKNLTVIPGPVQCGARLTYSTAQSDAVINQVGVDDGSTNLANIGKFCSTPAVVNGVSGIPGQGSCRQYGVVATPVGTARATATVTVAGGSVQNPGTVTDGGSGYTSAPGVTLSAPNRVGATASLSWSGNSGLLTNAATLSTATNGPYATTPTGVIGGGTCVDTSDTYCTGGSLRINVPGTPSTRTGQVCTSDDFNSATGCNGGACVVTVTGGATSSVTFPGATGQVYCTSTPTITLDNNAALQAAQQATAEARFSSTTNAVTAIVVTGAGSGYLSAPTVTIAPPGTGDVGKLCAPTPITGIGVAVTEGITTTGVCQPLGRDTQFNRVCSTPAVDGGLWSALNTATCNVISSFRNQPSPTDTNKCGILTQSFVTSVIPPPPPAPAPSPAPKPAPSPAPTPSAPTPAPTPSAPVVCSYRGIYEIIPLYAPCNRYRIASGTDSDCDYNLVTLRTAGQVGQGKIARLHWEFATIAEDGLSVPTNVLARARRGCTNRFLAAPSDPTTLKTGGSSWKWQFVPWPGAISCEEVNVISQNRLSTTAFLQVPRSCDRFRYNATDGGRQRFRLRRVNLPV